MTIEPEPRINLVLAGRKITPWAKSLGISGTTQQALKTGGNITGDVLTVVQRVENVSVSWLLTGRGRPFLVNECDGDDEAIERIGNHLADEPDKWTVEAAAAPGLVVLVLRQPGGLLRLPDPAIKYDIVEVFAGFGAKTLRHFAPLAPAVGCYQMSPIEVMRLARGQMGTYELLGPATRPRPRVTLPMSELIRMVSAVDVQPLLTPDEKIVLDHYRAMDQEGKTAYKSVGASMAKPPSGVDPDVVPPTPAARRLLKKRA